MRKRQRMNTSVVVAAVLLVAATVQAATKTWTGTGDWFTDTANWSGGLPGPGDDVVVSSGSLLMSGSTPALASFTLNGGTVTMTNWTTELVATEVTLNGGNLTCAGEFLTGAMSNRVFITCSNLTINSGGKIDVSSRGYKRGIGANPIHGQGPGGGYSFSGSYAGGAGHGGAGGTINLTCRALSGTGVLTAKGGSATNVSNNGGGGGGGGRIALFMRNREQWTGSTLDQATLVPGGLGNKGNGQPGSVHLVDLPPLGTQVILR